MPRRGENIYKRKDGRWEGRIKTPGGKYRYFYGKTYKTVRTKKEELLKRTAAPNSAQGPKINAAESYRAWLLGDLCKRVKPSTYQNYFFCMDKYVIPFFQKAGNERITKETVSLFNHSVEDNDFITDSYKRKILTIFKTATRDVLKGTEEFAAVAGVVRLPKTENSSVQVFTVREQRLVENAVLKSKDQRALGIVLCLYSGIRLGELCALKWSDVDPDAGTMAIVRTVSRTKKFAADGRKTALLVGMPKSRKSLRTIPLPGFFVTIFKTLKKESKGDSDYILTNSQTPMDPRTYQRIYKKILKRAGVSYRKFHTTRHTFATRALELNVDMKTLSEILGHSNVSITLNIYAHSLMEQKKIAIEKLDRMHEAQLAFVSIAVTNPVVPV